MRKIVENKSEGNNKQQKEEKEWVKERMNESKQHTIFALTPSDESDHIVLLFALRG